MRVETKTASKKILRKCVGLGSVDPGFVEGEKRRNQVLRSNLTSIHAVQEELGAGEGQGDLGVPASTR